jgi:hypothetical protein
VNLEKARERLDAKIAAWSLLDKDEEGRFADLPKLKKIKELNEANWETSTRLIWSMV